MLVLVTLVHRSRIIIRRRIRNRSSVDVSISFIGDIIVANIIIVGIRRIIRGVRTIIIIVNNNNNNTIIIRIMCNIRSIRIISIISIR